MTLHQRRTIFTLSRTDRFGRTVVQCHVGQPVLGVTINKLEEELGVILFQRSRNQARPTPTGQRIINGAVCVLDENVATIGNIAQQSSDPRRAILNPATRACKVQKR